MSTLVDCLVQPDCGLISQVMRLPVQPGEHDFTVLTASLGDLSRSIPALEQTIRWGHRTVSPSGSGSGLNTEEARVKAVAEALERYCSCIYRDEQFIWATARELGDEALDLDTVARCSQAELAHSKCCVTTPDKSAPMRWVKGVSLTSRRPIWIPAVMVYLNLPAITGGERFWLPISTGCAAHPSIWQALVSAICEVVERDAISLTWLQQLPLPRLDIDVESEVLSRYLARADRSQVKTLLFDATTDLGIPTVYSVDLSPHHAEVQTSVACVTELDPVRAVCKVHYETTSGRIALQANPHIPSSPDDFHDVAHGAVFMGRSEQAHAFQFLTESPGQRRLSEMPNVSTGSPETDVRWLLQRFAERSMDVVAVELTTDEALRAGMRVVRVIIPALQPLSFLPRARFLGHARLYEAPRLMGYTVRRELQLNPWPQPFA